MASQLRASRVPIIAIYLLLLGLFLFVFLHSFAGKAYAANPQLINFQGKVVNSDGTNVSNGNYDFDFILYDDPTAGTNRWQEGWTSGTSQVTVTNGVFRVALGTHTALPNFNTYPNLYLAIKFNNDAAGYMTPRVRLTSVPYALNSDAIGGLTAANFVQLAQGMQTDSSITNASIAVNKTNASGTPNILQLQKAGVNAMVVDNSGQTTLGQAGNGGANGTLIFSTTNASGTTITIQAASTGTSYSLTLPTTGPSTSQCLQSDSVTASQLVFGSCSGSAGTLASTYNSTGTSGNTIVLASAGGGVLIQDADTPIAATLFAVQEHTNDGASNLFAVTTSGLTVENTSGNDALTLDTSTATAELRVHGSTQTEYARIWFDSATDTAYFGASTGTAVLGSGTGAVNVTAGAGAAFTITGNAASTISTTAGNLSLQGGSGTIQLASSILASTGELTIQTPSNSDFSINGGKAISIDAATASSIRIGDASNNLTLSATTREPNLAGTARHTRRIIIPAEYAGASMTADGTSNTGTMTSDNMTTTPFRNFYKWLNTQGTAQDYDIWVRVPLPTDYSAMPTGQTICMDTYASATTANTVMLTLYDTNNTVVGTTFDLTPTSTNTWQSKCTTSITAGTYAANGIMTLDIKLTAPATTGDVRISNFYFDYLSKW